MYTSNQHILFCLQKLGQNYYVRVVPVDQSKTYFDELESVYGIKTDIHDPNIYVMHNCGDLYEHLINNIKFKKFKGLRAFTNVCEGIWLVDADNSDVTLPDWFIKEFRPWVRIRLFSFITDLGETNIQQFLKSKMDNFDWSSINVNDYVTTYTDAQQNRYCILNAEPCVTNNMMVLTENHVMSLIAKYTVLDAKFTEQQTTIDEARIETNMLITNTNERGLMYSNNLQNTLTKSDVEQILNYLEIDINALVQLYMSFVRITNIPTDYFAGYSITETNCASRYSFLEDENEPLCCADLDAIIEEMRTTKIDEAFKSYIFQNTVIKPQIYGIAFPDDANANANANADTVNIKAQNTTSTFTVYKNMLDNVIMTLSDISHLFPRTLKEVVKLSDFSYKSPVTKDIIQCINKRAITSECLAELRELLCIIKPENTIDQRSLTEKYVEKYKDDAFETLASVVISNVYAYLEESALNSDNINKNQIGQDLVDLGVKKTRKAKGFVYGIKDTSVSNI